MSKVEHLPPVETGDFDIVMVPGGTGAVYWQGIEILRGVNCLVRDINWGTFSIEEFSETRAKTVNGHTAIRQNFNVNDGALAIEMQLSIDPGGLFELAVDIYANQDQQTNRAGLVVLHPLAGVSGHDLIITHPDGTVTNAQFPLRISPHQPAQNISALSHNIAGADVDISFSGDVFEMEDQRNWSDASFKTYCRPLALPFPYVLKAGETVRQTLRLKLKRGENRAAKQTQPKIADAKMPEILLALEKNWLAPDDAWPIFKTLGAKGLLVRVNAAEIRSDSWQHMVQFARYLGAFVDLELVLSERDFGVEIKNAAAACAALQLEPAHVLALPDIWLKSWQPGQGPSVASQIECNEAAKLAFPGSKIGSGMLTNFTELNRYPVLGGDYICHANTAIVHAADDLSVWQTLEALPQIFASGQFIAGHRGYRLGLVSIGMRTNPYGLAVAENPERQRKAMAGDDPRQHQTFAAAYAICTAIQAAFGGIEAIALAAPIGRFGIFDPASGQVSPLFHAVRAMAELSGQNVHLLKNLAHGLMGIESACGKLILANCSCNLLRFESGAPLKARLLNAVATRSDWLDISPPTVADHFDLEPGQCLFALRDLP